MPDGATDTRDLIIELKGRVESLNDTVKSSNANTREQLDRLREDTIQNRTEFRSDMFNRMGDLDRRITDLKKELTEAVNLKADKAVVEPMKRNLNTVAMFIIIAVLSAGLALVIINRSPVPEAIRSSTGTK